MLRIVEICEEQIPINDGSQPGELNISHVLLEIADGHNLDMTKHLKSMR